MHEKTHMNCLWHFVGLLDPLECLLGLGGLVVSVAEQITRLAELKPITVLLAQLGIYL